ncbi:MAG: hypothetical protein NVV73_19650 [Cellvibrionaceae bacterium]|nr:hypothetical protein [Cellvibrionaceae bacterium]
MLTELPLEDEELELELEDDELDEFEEELELELEDELEPVPEDELSPPQAVKPSASSTTPPKRNGCFFKFIIMIGALYGLLRLVQALRIYFGNASHMLLQSGILNCRSTHFITLSFIQMATHEGIAPIYVT